MVYRWIPICIGMFLFAQSVSAKVAVSEVLWMGSDLSTSDEWVELTANADTDISGYRLSYLNSKGQEATIHHFATGSVIGSGEYLVIANTTAAFSRLEDEPWVSTTAMSLPNTKLKLWLRDATGQIVDDVDDGVGEPFAGKNGSGPEPRYSMERINLWGSGSSKAHWITAKTFAGFDDGSVMFGTPGYAYASGYDLDVFAPFEAQDLLLKVISGSIVVTWKRSLSLDLAAQEVSVLRSDGISTSTLLPATAEGFQEALNTGSGTLEIHLVSIDKLGNASEGISRKIDDVNMCSVAPGFRPIILERGPLTAVGSVTVDIRANEDEQNFYSCSINFGDGSTTNSCDPPEHAYSKAGGYSLSLEAVNHCGTTLKQTLFVQVEAPVPPAPVSTTVFVQQSGGSQTSSPAAPMSFGGAPLGSDIAITGALPNPAGKDDGKEWVELKNKSSVSVSLQSSTLTNAKGSKKHVFGATSLLPGEAKRFSVLDTGLTLTNSSDEVRLIDGFGSIVSSLSWADVKDDQIVRPAPDSGDRISCFVTRVVDGDTYDCSFDPTLPWLPRELIRVRLLGVDAPESVDPRKPVEAGGKEASIFLRALIEGKNVELEFDTYTWDVYDRLLAYVYTANQESVQELLLSKGLAKVYTKASFSKKDAFLALQSSGGKMNLLSSKIESKKNDEALTEEDIETQSGASLIEQENDSQEVFIGSILISEISPLGADEWVELLNIAENSVDLKNYKIRLQKGSKLLVIPIKNTLVVQKDGYVVIKMKDLGQRLRDDGSPVELLGPNGELISTATYPKLKTGQSYAAASITDVHMVTYCTATPTPGATNTCNVPLPKKTAVKKVPAKKATTKKVSAASKTLALYQQAIAGSDDLPDEEVSLPSGQGSPLKEIPSLLLGLLGGTVSPLLMARGRKWIGL